MEKNSLMTLASNREGNHFDANGSLFLYKEKSAVSLKKKTALRQLIHIL